MASYSMMVPYGNCVITDDHLVIGKHFAVHIPGCVNAHCINSSVYGRTTGIIFAVSYDSDDTVISCATKNELSIDEITVKEVYRVRGYVEIFNIFSLGVTNNEFNIICSRRGVEIVLSSKGCPLYKNSFEFYRVDILGANIPDDAIGSCAGKYITSNGEYDKIRINGFSDFAVWDKSDIRYLSRRGVYKMGKISYPHEVRGSFSLFLPLRVIIITLCDDNKLYMNVIREKGKTRDSEILPGLWRRPPLIIGKSIYSVDNRGVLIDLTQISSTFRNTCKEHLENSITEESIDEILGTTWVSDYEKCISEGKIPTMEDGMFHGMRVAHSANKTKNAYKK